MKVLRGSLLLALATLSATFILLLPRFLQIKAAPYHAFKHASLEQTTIRQRKTRMVKLRKFHELPSPARKMQFCDGLSIASAYFKYENASTVVEMTTEYLGYLNYTPFTPDSVKCKIGNVTGSFLSTKIHYTRCSVPLPADAYVNLSGGKQNKTTVSIINTYGKNICAVELWRLDPQPKLRYTVSALTTVQNSETYFREWVNYLFCTGWSHLYVYDDASNGPMKALLASMARSRFITVTDWSHAHAHNGRQYMAMQDFLIRFRYETKVVAQQDDDVYYVAMDKEGQLITDVASYALQYFDRPGLERLCQLQASSHWFGHGGIRQRSKPLALSSIMRANTSLSSSRIEWKGSSNAATRSVDSTLAIARTEDIDTASGITHRWVMKNCRTGPVNPPNALYFHHYKVKPWLEKKVDAKQSTSWGLYNTDETFWENTANHLHQVNDTTMHRLDAILCLSTALQSAIFPPKCCLQ